MLNQKSLNLGCVPFISAQRLVLTILASLSLSACTTVIPGLDRIQFPSSSAIVGPLVSADDAQPEKKQTVIAKETSTTTTLETVVAPVGKKSGAQAVEADSAVAQTGELQPNQSSPETITSEPSAPIAVEYGGVVGRVVLEGEAKQQLPATGTMVTLTPKMMVDEVRDRPSEVHIIDMEDKTYLPRYSTIHAGDQVVFVNKDKIQHNVFSSSGNNAFDLGTYGAGLKRAVTLEEPGIVKIYCNIHPEMATFVAVGDQKLSVRTDDAGRYTISDVLPGLYEIAIWNIRGESKRVIEVKADQTVELLDRIDTTAFIVEPHKNKFGGNYSKNTTLFEDEFY